MLTRFQGFLTARMDDRPLRVLRVLIGAAAMVKGVDIAFRLAGAQPGPGQPWIPGVPDLVTPITAPGFAIAWFLAAGALTIGAWPAVAAAALAVFVAIFTAADLRLYNQHLYLLGLVCLLMCAAFTGTRRPAAGQSGTLSAWPINLIMLQLSLVYAFGAVAKLSVDFVTGRLLYWDFSDQPVASIFGPWILDASVLVPMSLGVLLAEAFLAVAVWVPRLRWAVLAIAGPLHFGMIVFLPHDAWTFVRLVVFGALQLAILLVLFAPRQPVVVVWDDACSFCGRWATLFRRLDWLHLVQLIPISQSDRYEPLGIRQDDAYDALQLRSVDGSVHAGFEAVRRLAYLFPLTMLIAPWLALFPVRRAGDWGYRRVARRRSCAVRAIPGTTTPASAA
jgi:predicted DCC family thiol-disulfide oxidoreductase YuxK